MALPFDVANFNLINFANIYPDIMDSEPKDVTYQYKDENGNILTKTIANRGKFKQQLWDDVGAALGQFNRTFYVDADNGDDNNDGSSTAPFATIKKAIDSVPIGGKGVISLSSASAPYEISQDIYIINKLILLVNYTDTKPEINISLKNSNTIYKISIQFGYLYLRNIKINFPIPNDIVNPNYSETYFIFLGSGFSEISLNRCNIYIPYSNDYGYFRFSGNSKYWDASTSFYSLITYVTNFYMDNGSPISIASNKTMSFSFRGSNFKTFDGSADRDIKELIEGIMLNANGYPLNIVSNIDFTN